MLSGGPAARTHADPARSSGVCVSSPARSRGSPRVSRSQAAIPPRRPPPPTRAFRLEDRANPARRSGIRPVPTSSVGTADRRQARGRHVQRRVPLEEAVRPEREADRGDRHHRPVLRPRDVRVGEDVPEHHVGVRDRAVGRGPARQAVAAGVLVRVVAGRVPLVGAVRRHPEVVRERTRPACSTAASGWTNGGAFSPGHEPVADRLAQRGSSSTGLTIRQNRAVAALTSPPRRRLARQQRRLGPEGVAVRVVRARAAARPCSPRRPCCPRRRRPCRAGRRRCAGGTARCSRGATSTP